MPKTYSAGDPITAAEYNAVVKTTGLFAADAGGDDTYAITVTPAPTAYADGDVFRFTSPTANTGAASLNVNTLGAISILRADGSALANGDISANQMVEVQYRNGNFYLLSPLANAPKFAHGTATRTGNTASGDQTIAHGLGRAPRFVRISARKKYAAGTGYGSGSDGTYDGSAMACTYFDIGEATGNNVTTSFVVVIYDGTGTVHQKASIAVDATNITLTWTMTGSPSSNIINMIWEAEA